MTTRLGTAEHPLLSAEKLSVQLGSSTILHEVNLSLAGGELLAIRGASGSGKTTLLHVLAGLLPPSGGKVLFRGKRIDN
ncbi:MAG: ABC transporter ATP-binding protein, partial [Angustibacter sp.]